MNWLLLSQLFRATDERLLPQKIRCAIYFKGSKSFIPAYIESAVDTKKEDCTNPSKSLLQISTNTSKRRCYTQWLYCTIFQCHYDTAALLMNSTWSVYSSLLLGLSILATRLKHCTAASLFYTPETWLSGFPLFVVIDTVNCMVTSIRSNRANRDGQILNLFNLAAIPLIQKLTNFTMPEYIEVSPCIFRK